MNKALLGLTTLALGALAGHFVTKKVLDTRYQANINDLRDWYHEQLNNLGVMEEGFRLDDETMEDEDEEDLDSLRAELDEELEKLDARYGLSEVEEVKRAMAANALQSYRGGSRKQFAVDYTKPPLEALMREGVSVVVPPNDEAYLGDIEPDTGAEDDEYIPSDDPEYEAELERLAEDYAVRRSENMQRGEPYLVEPEEYHEGPEEYDRQALYYYALDCTLCEDDDSLVEHEEECVGFDYEDMLRMQTTCWVRNDKIRVLYEIHRIDESYQKAVLGVSETPREREFRIQGRRKQALDNRGWRTEGPVTN